jgi:tetratricopeptide (TPR) repeat protein
MSEQKIRLAHIYLEQADIARLQGNLPQSVEKFSKAIALYKDMAQEEPACWSLVADTIEKVGAMYKAAGELEKASEAYSEAAVLRVAIYNSEREKGHDD